MSAPVFFWVTSMRGAPRSYAVPVHVVNDPNNPQPLVRPLAGRYAGRTITIVRSELRRSLPSGARLVPGSREVLARLAPIQLEEVAIARRLRERLGNGVLTERRLQNLFDEVVEVAERVRRKTPSDRAWQYYDRSLAQYQAARLDRGYFNSGRDWRDELGILLVGMLDMVLGAAERYQRPQVDERSVAYVRALALEDDANALSRNIGRSAVESPRAWLEVADALEVVEDAWREAGVNDRADNIAAQRANILATIRLAYSPGYSLMTRDGRRRA